MNSVPFVLYILIFIFGTIVGSFLNVVILRYNTGNSIIFSSSRCFSCGKKLKWFELIPIFSFLIQKGRCRYCKSKISLQYPTVEFLTGIIFVLIAYKISNFQFLISNQFLNFNFQFLNQLPISVYYWLVFALLIVISVYDIRHQIIPNKIVYLLIFLSFFSFIWDLDNWDLFRISNFEFGISTVWPNLLAGPAFFSFFGLLWLVSKGKWMGLGDAKLAFGIGWFLGFEAGIIALILSFWLGAIIGIFLLLIFPKNFTIKSKIPFGPFLCLGTMVAFLFSSELLRVYFNLLNLWM